MTKNTPFLFVKNKIDIKIVTENWNFLGQIKTHCINVVFHSCCLILPFLLLPGVNAVQKTLIFHWHYIVKSPTKVTVKGYFFFRNLQQETDTGIVPLNNLAEILEHLKVILISYFDMAFSGWIFFRVPPHDTLMAFSK